MERMRLLMTGFLGRLKQGLKKARVERDLVRNSFARFVSHSHVTSTESTVPVFCFHAVTSAEFEEALQHLQRNNYQTIGCDELVRFMRGEEPSEKSVVLTFDDGWRSTWTIAYPLLKKYGFNGISFLVPTWMNDDAPSSTLDDHWNGKSTIEQIHGLERGMPYLSWSEAKIMQDEGVFEFQSHSQTHDTVFTSDELVDFVNPAFHRVPHKIPLVGNASLDPFQRSSQLGMPLYTVAPRLTGATRFIDDDAVRDECIELVKSKGGDEFFRNPNWQVELRDIVAKHHLSSESQYLSESERNDGIRQELQQSKEVIEERLGNSVRHFCFPFYAGSELASQISKELGYESNYWGWAPTSQTRRHDYGRKHLYAALDETDYATGDVLQGRRTNRADDDPMRIVRLPGDYIHRLPGAGRRSISSMFVRKSIRNLKK